MNNVFVGVLINSSNFVPPSFMFVQLVRGPHFAHRCYAVLSLYIRRITTASLCDFSKCNSGLRRTD